MPNVRRASARARLIHQLRKSDQTGAADLAEHLAVCTTEALCGSAACPVCGGRFQQTAVALFDRAVRLPARDDVRGRTTAITIIPTSGCVDAEGLSVGVFERVRTEIATALRQADLPPFMIGIEASFNEDQTGQIEPHWCVHAHGIGYNWLSDRQKQALRASFHSSAMVKRPVRIEPLDHDPRGRHYPFKPERYRRQSYLAEALDGGRQPNRTTRRKHLRLRQAVDLAVVEHRVGFRERLLRHGIDESPIGKQFEGLEWARDGP